MLAIRTGLLFALSATAEIGGCWLIWQAVRQGRPWWLAVGGLALLAVYGFSATAQQDTHFGRVLAAYGGVFVVGSLLWGTLFDGFHPSRSDLLGAGVCLLGVVIIMAGSGR